MTTIDRYRSTHRIRPTTRGRDRQTVCAVDGLLIHSNRNGRFRHDPTEVREAAEEAGRVAVWRERHVDA